MKKFKKILAALALLAAGTAALYFGFHIDSVKVEGTEIYTKDEIQRSVFARKFSDNEIMFMIYNKLFGINKLPFVEDIEVVYESRDTVLLRVYDRTISGCIKYMGQFVYFDRDGRVLQSLPERRKGVPIVTGINFKDFTIGEKFQVDKDDGRLFNAIMNVSQLIGHYGIDVKRIHVNDGEITIYSGNVQVYLGKKEMYNDQLAALSSVLKTANDKKLSGVINMENYEFNDNIILRQN